MREPGATASGGVRGRAATRTREKGQRGDAEMISGLAGLSLPAAAPRGSPRDGGFRGIFQWLMFLKFKG